MMTAMRRERDSGPAPCRAAVAAPRRRPGSAPRSGFPWTTDEIAKLSDAVADGVPPKSIALTLGRSHEAVLAQMKLMGLTTGRVGANARQIVTNLRADAAGILDAAANARHMSLNRLCRYVLELAARERAWLDALIDDDAVEQRHDALPLTDPRPLPASTGAAAVVPEPSQAAPVAPAFTIALSSVQLEGRLYG